MRPHEGSGRRGRECRRGVGRGEAERAARGGGDEQRGGRDDEGEGEEGGQLPGHGTHWGLRHWLHTGGT